MSAPTNNQASIMSAVAKRRNVYKASCTPVLTFTTQRGRHPTLCDVVTAWCGVDKPSSMMAAYIIDHALTASSWVPMGDQKCPRCITCKGHRQAHHQAAKAGGPAAGRVLVGLEETALGHYVELVQLSTHAASLRHQRTPHLKGWVGVGVGGTGWWWGRGGGEGAAGGVIWVQKLAGGSAAGTWQGRV